MNSHDEGLLYAQMSHEDRQRYTQRKIRVSDIADAMKHGFKAEPDLSPCHLPLLSDEALARIHAESEKWRDKSHERALEEQVLTLNAQYITLREIIGADHVPPSFRSVLSQPQHVAWTEQKARELVAEAKRASGYAEDAKKAEQRVDLLELYVKTCDAKRIPYNWNVFAMSTAALRHHVQTLAVMERLTRCDCNPERVAWFETRTQQETEQSLRWHAQRAEETRKLIGQYAGTRIDFNTAEKLTACLMARHEEPGDWIVWEWDYKPNDLPDEQMVDVMLHTGAAATLEAGVVEWSDVKQYRRRGK